MYSCCFTKNAFYQAQAVAQRCSAKMMFLEISQNSPEKTCFRASGTGACFPVNFAKFLRTPFLTEHFWFNPFQPNVAGANESQNKQINPFLDKVSHFYTTWKHQKTKGFLVFSGGCKVVKNRNFGWKWVNQDNGKLWCMGLAQFMTAMGLYFWCLDEWKIMVFEELPVSLSGHPQRWRSLQQQLTTFSC